MKLEELKDNMGEFLTQAIASSRKLSGDPHKELVLQRLRMDIAKADDSDKVRVIAGYAFPGAIRDKLLSMHSDYESQRDMQAYFH